MRRKLRKRTLNSRRRLLKRNARMLFRKLDLRQGLLNFRKTRR